MWRLLQPVRPGEHRELASAFLTLFCIMAGHALLETARDALFLASLPPERLPWVYLFLAAAALGISFLQRKGVGRVSGRTSLSLFLAFSGVLTVALWHYVMAGDRPALFLLYGWTGLFATLALIRFWLLASDIFTVTQAKRLFPLIGAGSVSGAILGSALARVLAARLGAESVLLAGAVMVLLSSLPPLLIPATSLRFSASRPLPTTWSAWKADMRLVLRDPYIRRVALFLWIASVMFTVVDYVFKSTAAAVVPPDSLGTFFSGVYLGLNVLSLLVQLVLVGWFVRVLGVIRSLLVMPLLLIAGAVGVAVGGGMLAALILKGSDASLRHSLHRTAVETLYVPLPGDLRTRLKGLVDTSGQRGGQAAASLLILGVLALGAGTELLAVLVILLGMMVLMLGLELRVHYLDIFRATLKDGGRPRSGPIPELDMASLETLIATLNSADDAEVLATLDLLAEQDRVRLIPALILYHPSSAVVLRALEIFGKWGRDDFLAMVPRLINHSDPEIRGAALRASSGVHPDPDLLLREFLDDEDETVRATALVGLVHAGVLEGEEAQRALAKLETGASSEERVALARAIWHQPEEVFVPVLHRLYEDEDPEVRLAVAQAMEEIGDPSYLPVLLEMLADRRLRDTARRAMVRMGEQALEHLQRALSDPRTRFRVRRHIPRTISRFGGEEAARILLEQYPEETEGLVRYKILRGLGRMRTDDPELQLDAGILERATRETVEVICRLIAWRLELLRGATRVPERGTPTQKLLAQMLQDKESRAFERLFRLLGLQYGLDDMYSIYRGLRSHKRELRASSRELLEHLLPAALRDAVLSLVDDTPDEERLSGARQFHREPARDYEGTVRAMIGARSDSLAALAGYHAGEMKLHALAPAIRELESRAPALLREVLERARELLDSPRTERLSYE